MAIEDVRAFPPEKEGFKALDPQNLQVVHNLNCAKLKPHPGDSPADPCSCGAEKQVHNHGPSEGPGLGCPEYRVRGELKGFCLLTTKQQHMLNENKPWNEIPGQPEPVEAKPDTSGEEWNKASADYRSKIASVRFPRPEAPVGPPVASEDFGATLTRWWVGKAQEEASALVPKAAEYGGAHRASDLTQLGRTIAELMGADLKSTDHDEGWYQELACYFYIQGKLGRWQAALLEGRKVSDDTVHDIKVYTTMVQRIREVGGWPV